MFLPGAVLILLKPPCPFYHIETRQSVTMEVFQHGMRRSKEKGEEEKQDITWATEERTLRTTVFPLTYKCPCASGSFSYFSKYECAGKYSVYTEPNFLHIICNYTKDLKGDTIIIKEINTSYSYKELLWDKSTQKSKWMCGPQWLNNRTKVPKRRMS